MREKCRKRKGKRKERMRTWGGKGNEGEKRE